MTDRIPHYISGKRVQGSSKRFVPIFNPATGKQTAEVGLATADEVAKVVAVANEAAQGWAAMPPIARGRVMWRFKDLLEARQDEVARVLTDEHGKILSDALGEIARGLEVVEFSAGIPHLMRGDSTVNVGSNVDSHSMRQPLGVVAGITPFNFPVMVPIWMFAIALACGNAFILKPSERDPSAPLLMADMLKEAGLPDGVFNVVQGDKEAVDAILEHPDIAAVSFVGSTPIARYVYHTGCAADKRVQALGGAKNHMIVMPDADLDKTTDALMGAAYGAAGERCMAISVAVAVGDEVADNLIEKLAPRVSSIKVGPGTDPDVDMGPLITKQHLERVEGFIAKGVEEGAKLLVDGRGMSLQGYEDGYYTGGSLFDHVKQGMTIHSEEIFGPVLSVMRASSFDEAVSIINDHAYGNGTSIFTSDGDAARTFADKIKVGMVGVNVPIPVPVAYHSFGGWKGSLFGGHNIYGMEGISFYTKIKTVTSRWPSGIRQGAEYVMPTMK